MTRLFVQDLMVMDFSYLDAERGLLGESWRLDLELGGSLDRQGMLLDFGAVKPIVKRLVDTEFDHRLLLPERHPGLRLERGKDDIALTFPLADSGEIFHRGPATSVALIPVQQIEPAAVADAITARLRTQIPDNIDDVGLKLVPEPSVGAFYHYSHGLKQHAGNCQRIAHGHRSRIEVERNGQRDTGLESLWADRWRDIYVGTRQDLADTVDVAGQTCLVFRYQASQGNFELRLPADRCYLIDTDSTVENLAQHIAAELASECPGDRILVRAYEGIGKGAVAEAGPV